MYTESFSRYNWEVEGGGYETPCVLGLHISTLCIHIYETIVELGYRQHNKVQAISSLQDRYAYT